MSEIKELKELVGRGEINSIKGILSPYKELSNFIVQLENKINSLRDNVAEKPKTPRRKSSPKVTEE